MLTVINQLNALNGGGSVSSTTGGTGRTDNFTRADSATTINPPSDGGTNWALDTAATWGISSNQGYTAVTSGSNQDIIVLQSSASDVTVQVTLSVVDGTTDAGLVAREVDSNNYLMLITTRASTNLRLFKNVAGTLTQLGSTVSYTAANGDVLKLTVSGTSITGYVNSVSQIAVTDSAGQTNTRHGLRTFNEIATRFSAFSIVSP